MSDSLEEQTAFWKRKLAAYLHDPPSKCLDIWTHAERSREAMSRAGFSENEIGKYAKDADHTAAAADRFPFPQSRSANLSCHFDGVRNGFIHPLAGVGDDGDRVLRFHSELKHISGIEGDGSEVQPCWQTDKTLFKDEAEAWKARFFLHWRLWPQLAAEKEYRWKFLPADTRMPDHSIWTHMGVVSALAGCDEDAHKPLTEYKPGTQLKAAFLKFQLGPVQDFIAAARSTRDLWSGSYLLSWLMAAGLEEVANRVGPDAVIFPNLWGQPLLDYRFKASLWDQVKLDRGTRTNQTAWDAYFHHTTESLLTPNLPNVFLVVVPEAQAEAVAEAVKMRIQEEWKKIGKSVWKASDGHGLMEPSTLGTMSKEDRKTRFDGQLAKHLSFSWQVTPWPDTVAEARTWCANVPEDVEGRDAERKLAPTLTQRFETVVKAATEGMRVDDRDRRYYTDDTKTELNNVGLAWPLLYALNGWALDATRKVRDFTAWGSGGWDVGVGSNKDSLTGKEEAVAGGREWQQICNDLTGAEAGRIGKRFKHESDWLGAVTLVKRLWDLTYLKPQWDLDPIAMPSTRGLAKHAPFSDGDDDPVNEKLSGEKYFAVLAFDGDNIGQWVSGAKTPPYVDILANYEGGGAREYFERYPDAFEDFSEALSNFALKCAARVVEAHDGRLIYAGGDDVLAMLPADAAIACAKDLVTAFQGRPVHRAGITDVLKKGLKGLPEGFLSIDDEDEKTQDGFHIPFVVPGPTATASVGIAIAHFKSPLQDAVREAQKAEKRAKKKHNRDALAVTLMKRSGEIVEWGCQWSSGGIALYERLFEAGRCQELSSRFPYRLMQLLSPYLSVSAGHGDDHEHLNDVNGFDAGCVILTEARHALKQHHQGQAQESTRAINEITALFEDYLAKAQVAIGDHPHAATQLVEQVTGLCQTVAFAVRNVDPDERKDAQKPNSNEVA
jgi:CRISPR-associated protein Cmr2